jgi:hypothetical protein
MPTSIEAEADAILEGDRNLQAAQAKWERLTEADLFNVSLEQHLLPDPEGQDLPDPGAAWETARRIALDAMRVDEVGPVDCQTCHVEVTDEDGETVLEFPFERPSLTRTACPTTTVKL